jgi:hypothetical protein
MKFLSNLKIKKLYKMYTCSRCDYTTINLNHFKKHINRKNICKPIENDIDINILREKYNNKGRNTEFKCEYCEEIFENAVKKFRHKQKCSNNPEIDEKNQLKNEILELKKIIKDNNISVPSYKTHNNNINNTNTNISHNTNSNINSNNSTQNNIIINNFGNESLEHITPEFLDKCLLKLNNGMKDLIKNIHFNDDIPENKNIKFKSERYNLLQKYENGEWLDCDKNNTLDELIHKGFKILNQHYFKSRDENEKLKEYKDVIMNFFCELIQQSSNDYFSLRRDIFITIKNNVVYLVGK